MAPPDLPPKLVTIFPPWCTVTTDEISNAAESEPAPSPFCLTVPHSLRRGSHLWEILGNTDGFDNRSLKRRIAPVCEEIRYYQENDKNELYGLSKSVVIKYGETALRVLRRVWDLHLVYNHKPKIPGNDPGVFDQSTWLATIRDTVLYRMHYAEDFKVASHDQVRNGVYVTDVLVQEHRDRVERAIKEREVFTAMVEELTQDSLTHLPGYKATALGAAPLQSLKRCAETAEAFYVVFDEEEDILENEDESDMRYYQAFQLWHIAARAAMNWEPRRPGAQLDVLSMYCEDILRRRKIEKSKRDAELREQLEAILGDTRGEQGGMGSEAAESGSENEFSSQPEDEDGSSDEDEDEEGEEDSDDDDRPIFGHYTT
ncbi:hypothetical protein QYS62_004887 [Fusarium acuminatum]|uniref:Uncharacterized protein n=1 Tax=Fusarium acuminatum TaxID=5515 RepID=A0ABZ2WT17_9HYPO